jgi:hypothetical protein
VRLLETREDVTNYIDHLMWGIEHHAASLKGVAETALTHLLRYAEQPPQVRTFRGSIANALWATIGGQRYAFSAAKNALSQYSIVIKRGGVQGPVVATLTATMSRDEIVSVFRQLKYVGKAA